MKKILFLLILVFPMTVFSKDYFHKRLETLYEIDKKKCLETSKRYIKWFPEKAPSYYYASVIYQEKSTKSRTLQGSYRNLRHAIGYALKFEEKDRDELRNEVNWDEYRVLVSRQAMELVERLNEIGEFQYGESLLARLETFDKSFSMVEQGDVVQGEETPLFERDDLASTPVTSEASVPAVEFTRIEGHFYGLPTGSENIPSADLGAELKVISMINKERRKRGLEPLEWDENLTRACRYHSYDLATQNYFNHDVYDRKNGKLVKVGGTFQRIGAFYDETYVNAENIAAGNASAEATYQQWFDSPGHHDTMFDPDSKKVGIGIYFDEDSPFGYYWTLCTAI
ncbi:MAG: CAP domain-containing protein [Crocinitomicaceae bacterium]|nr:CAP domain-containing protein [Crocinitomicaceae bacterium]